MKARFLNLAFLNKINTLIEKYEYYKLYLKFEKRYLVKSICIKSVSEEKINYLLELFEKLPINIYISKYRFKTFDNLIIHYPSKEQVEEFYEIVSLIIKKTIEYFYEDEFIRKNVEKNYFYLSNIERKYIFEITKKVLELPDEKIGYKNDILKNAIREFLKENKKILLEGFVNFRIKEYKELLDKIVEVSVFSYLDLTTF